MSVATSGSRHFLQSLHIAVRLSGPPAVARCPHLRRLADVADDDGRLVEASPRLPTNHPWVTLIEHSEELAFP